MFFGVSGFILITWQTFLFLGGCPWNNESCLLLCGWCPTLVFICVCLCLFWGHDFWVFFATFEICPWKKLGECLFSGVLREKKYYCYYWVRVLLLLGECGGVSVCPILICLLFSMYWYGKYRKLGICGILGDVVWCLIIFVVSYYYFLGIT